MDKALELKRLWKENRACHLCKLRIKCKGAVPGTGNPNARIVLVGEAPGAKEDETGYPFRPDAPAGRTLEELLDTAGLKRDDVWITNVVKCRPSEKNDTPTPDAMLFCGSLWLERELAILRPSLVVAAGAVATNFLSGATAKGVKHDMDIVHGLILDTYPKRKWTLMSSYHPAAPLHSPSLRFAVEDDFYTIGRVARGEPAVPVDAHPNPDYMWIDDVESAEWRETRDALLSAPVIAVDVELLPPYKYYDMFCYSLATEEGVAYALPPTKHNVEFLRQICQNESQRKVFHNLIGVDYQTLQRYDIDLVNFDDTIIRAYLLNLYPQSLKALSRRHLGMYMEEYPEIVQRERQGRMHGYLAQIMEREWDDPEPVLERKWNKKLGMLEEKTRKPQNVLRRVRGYLKKVEKDPEYSLWDAWHTLKKNDPQIAAAVEAVIGEVVDVSLKEVWESGKRDLVVWYSSRDADSTLRLYNLTQPYIESLGMVELLEMDLGAIPMAADMMRNGMKIDIEYFRSLAEEWQKGIDTAELQAWEAVGEPFLITSPDQTARILYDVLKYKVQKRKRTTDQATIETFAKEKPHAVLDAILEHRHLTKLRNTYATVLPKHADWNSRVHTTLKLTRTATGRLSSAEPINLMNQPTRSYEGKKIRKGFIAEDNHVLFAVDLSQIEMRILAHVSKDPSMTKIFRSGLDMHAATAAEVLGKLVSEVTKDERTAAKSTNFGLVYGETAEGLAAALGWSVGQAEDYIDMYFGRFPRVKTWLGGTKAHAANYGWVSDMIGRRRYIPEAQSPVNNVREEGFRQAINMPIQSSAQIPIKVPMRLLPQDFRESGLAPYVRPLIQIHDELMFEAHEDVWQDAATLVKMRMESALQLRVPVIAEAKVGKAWADMKEMQFVRGEWVEKEE